MARARVVLVSLLALVVAVGGLAYYAVHTGVGPLPDPQTCTATAAGHTTALSTAQAQNASIIAAVAERRGLPARAISIAIATAYQESKLTNLRGGDRDSVGLFQQRPSQGWGHRKQLLNRYYASNAFYDALVKVPGYETMPITRAAQQVQHSAYPSAYAAHELDGRTVASAMSGYSPAGFSCVVYRQPLPRQRPGPGGLTPRAHAVRHSIVKAFGPLPLGGRPYAHASTTSGGSAQGPGTGLDIRFHPATADNVRRGWVLASYLVANAKRLHIAAVTFDHHRWTAGTASQRGWRPVPRGTAAPANRVRILVS